MLDLDAERFLDEDIYQSYIVLHILQELGLKVIDPGLVLAKDVCGIKDGLTGIMLHHILHLITEAAVALLQGLSS